VLGGPEGRHSRLQLERVYFMNWRRVVVMAGVRGLGLQQC
jgi:hypothetical protein